MGLLFCFFCVAFAPFHLLRVPFKSGNQATLYYTAWQLLLHSHPFYKSKHWEQGQIVNNDCLTTTVSESVVCRSGISDSCILGLLHFYQWLSEVTVQISFTSSGLSGRDAKSLKETLLYISVFWVDSLN